MVGSYYADDYDDYYFPAFTTTESSPLNPRYWSHIEHPIYRYINCTTAQQEAANSFNGCPSHTNDVSSLGYLNKRYFSYAVSYEIAAHKRREFANSSSLLWIVDLSNATDNMTLVTKANYVPRIGYIHNQHANVLHGDTHAAAVKLVTSEFFP